MDFKTLLYKQEAGVGTITLNRPQALNALCDELTGELGQLLTMLEGEPDLRVLIITGNIKAFAAGADIAEMMDNGTLEAYQSIIKVKQVFDYLEELPIPTIAAINGACMGGGCELALCCDFRVAGEGALFALPETSLGIIPGCGGTQRLPLVVGPSRAKELIYFNDVIKAEKALEIGLVNRVVPDDKVMDEAIAMSGKLIKKPAWALKFAKESINCGVKTDFISGQNMELSRFVMAFSSEDQKEGMKSFYEKRKPVYKNR